MLLLLFLCDSCDYESIVLSELAYVSNNAAANVEGGTILNLKFCCVFFIVISGVTYSVVVSSCTIDIAQLHFSRVHSSFSAINIIFLLILVGFSCSISGGGINFAHCTRCREGVTLLFVVSLFTPKRSPCRR